jgi:DNA-binding Lrp family transcriptional regulator
VRTRGLRGVNAHPSGGQNRRPPVADPPAPAGARTQLVAQWRAPCLRPGGASGGLRGQAPGTLQTSPPPTRRRRRTVKAAARSGASKRNGSADGGTAKRSVVATQERPARSPRTERAGSSRTSRRQQDVLRLVKQPPGITVSEIAKELGVDATGLYRPVQELEQDRAIIKRGVTLRPHQRLSLRWFRMRQDLAQRCYGAAPRAAASASKQEEPHQSCACRSSASRSFRAVSRWLRRRRRRRPSDDLHDRGAPPRTGPRSARVAALDHARELGHRVGGRR